jgi:hypothetical protein
LQKAHRSGVAVGDDCLGSVLRLRNFGEPRRDRRQCLVPRDAREPPFALLADPFHRILQALVRIGTIEVARDLGAKHATRGGMIRGAANLDRAAVLHRGEKRAGVRAIMRAGAAHNVPAGG